MKIKQYLTSNRLVKKGRLTGFKASQETIEKQRASMKAHFARK